MNTQVFIQCIHGSGTTHLPALRLIRNQPGRWLRDGMIRPQRYLSPDAHFVNNGGGFCSLHDNSHVPLTSKIWREVRGGAYDQGNGRVVFTSAGHTTHALCNPEYVKLRRRAIRGLFKEI